MKFKVKEAYLLILIVLGLVSLSVYSTYALFTKEVTIDNVVSFNATLSLSDSNLVEYELVTLNPNETKIIELRVSNSSTSTLYYGCWYETLSNNPDITIGMYLEKSNVPSTGTLATTETKTLVVGIVNNSASTTLVNLGVVGSATSSLGLSSSRIIITDTFSPAIIVTDEVLAANTTTTTENVNLEYTNPQKYEITLYPGTYLLETWGAQGGDTTDSYEKCYDDDDCETFTSSSYGGKGGYSKGTLLLHEEVSAHIYVGGKGDHETLIHPSQGSSDAYYKGGFNGGGNSGMIYGGPGGGASDVRIGTDSLYARVIVAGGGGGSFKYYARTQQYGRDGAIGGGITGGTAGSTWVESGSFDGGTGGTQTSGGTSGKGDKDVNYDYALINGTFGTGGQRSGSTTYSGYYSGGGGGWYGGGGSNRSAGGGGSGYVYTADTATNYPTGCLLNSTYYLTNAETIAGDTSFTDFDGSTVTGHSGNGAVRISGTSQRKVYSIPRILKLSDVTILLGKSFSLTEGVTYECETGSTNCTYIGPNVTDTSQLNVGTNIVQYKIKDSNNEVYVYERKVNVIDNSGIDNSGANYPELTSELIPVVYDESTSTWVKADITSSTSTYGWYDYNVKKWANAVLVSSTNRSTYQSASAGTTIQDADILAFYVWIPRYKYKVWNINKVIGTDSYNAQTTGIDIVFESGTSSTGTISCTYSYAEPSSSAGSPNETCTGNNGEYYTHPAFTFGTDELKGFWMGKFELSSISPTTTGDGGGLALRILPNVTSWRGNSVSNFWKVIYDMQTANNAYGLSTSRISVDSHSITNMEWGAVAYLTNSKYGRCTNGSCTEVTINNCSTGITGIGADTVSANSSSTTCTTAANKYNGAKGMLASTTGNIYGVYDMSGGNHDFTMGNISTSNGTSYIYNANSAGSNFTYSTETAKYLIPYAYGTTSGDQAAYNRGRLGDATGEIVLSSGEYSGKAWYGDSLGFPYSSRVWFVRGGAMNNTSYDGGVGIFYSTHTYGTYADMTFSARATLTVFP